MNESLVTITGMDASASTPSGEGALVDIHLNITKPPSGWTGLFDQVWKQHIYMMKRRAHATDRHIVIRCMASELQSAHIPELKKAIANTDDAYRAAVATNQQLKQNQEMEEQRFKDGLNDIASKLKF